jgi:pyruvate carboxylase
MQPGDEISVEIDPGKTLEIRLQAVGETDETGEVKVFFELNGQPRVIRVPNRAVKAKTAAAQGAGGQPRPYRRADAGRRRLRRGDTAGQKVKPGDLLLTIEAMKMETGLHADREWRGQGVHVTPGAQIDAKDLLIEIT